MLKKQIQFVKMLIRGRDTDGFLYELPTSIVERYTERVQSTKQYVRVKKSNHFTGSRTMNTNTGVNIKVTK